MTTPTKDTLLALLKRKKLTNIADELENDITTFEEMLACTEAQWKAIAGIANGIFIYNHLHPSPHSSRISLGTDLLDLAQQAHVSASSVIQSPPGLSEFWNAFKTCPTAIQEHEVIQLPTDVFILSQIRYIYSCTKQTVPNSFNFLRFRKVLAT